MDLKKVLSEPAEQLRVCTTARSKPLDGVGVVLTLTPIFSHMRQKIKMLYGDFSGEVKEELIRSIVSFQNLTV